MRVASISHAVFAATLIALGALGLIPGHFAPIWQGVPKSFPAREGLLYLCSLVSLICGAGLLWRRTAGTVSRVLFAYLLLWMLLFKVPYIVRSPGVEAYYQSCGETAVLVAGAWVLYAWLADSWDKRQLGFAIGQSGLRLARLLYALALIAFGLSHFAYLGLTAPLVPAWLPWHVGWAYLTGSFYLAAGAAILTGISARLAATLAALQMALFTILVWIPLVAEGLAEAGQRQELALSWALTAAAWVIADSYHNAPWLTLDGGAVRIGARALLRLGQATDPNPRRAYMQKPSSSSKNVIAALVAAAFGLTAGTALAQTTSQSDQGNTSASHRPASKKSVRQLTSQVKHENQEMRATTGKLNQATAQLKKTTHEMKQEQSKEMRVASAEHKVRKGEHMQRSRIHRRNDQPANTNPPPR